MNEREIYVGALEKPSAAERAAFLDGACGGDEAVRRRLEALFREQAELGSFLESPPRALMPGADPTVVHAPPEGPGAVIGPYKLLEQVGEGGMGVVYVAEQTAPVRRRVALKVIKPGMDTRQVLARFEAERQALAMMDHPNIAKVHDAGATDSGRPYFVMELVKGIPITDYCDKARLSIAERLDLLVLVCRAVQHAHQKGVIHRDLKPSNILVTLIDGAAVPKVIDFGIAKTTGGPLTDRTIYTGFAQLVGTPLYMSPEQAELSGVDVDTRSDVYALGVLLYELLTGTTPIDREALGQAAFDEVRRIIREQETPTPSTRLATLGATLANVSANRQADGRALGHAVRGELDWIVMKALEKDRRRRYETASDFAADVMRHLTDQPVEACPPSGWYRFSKYARRHRAALTTAALVGLALVAGTAVSTWQAIRATRAGMLAGQREREAQRAVAESKAVLQFLVNDMLGASEAEKGLGRDIKLVEVLANAEKKIDAAFPGQPLVEAGVRHALVVAFDALGRRDVALRHGSRAHALYLGLLGSEHPDTLRALRNVASLLCTQGNYGEARTLEEQVLEIRRRTLGPEHPQTLLAMNNLAILLRGLGELDEARTLTAEVLEIRRRTLGPEHPQTLLAMGNLAAELATQARYDEARTLEEQTLEGRRRVLGPEHPETLMSMGDLATLLIHQGKFDEARTLTEKTLEGRSRVLGLKHSETLLSLWVWSLLSSPDGSDGDRARALEWARRAVSQNPGNGVALDALGCAQYRAGDWKGCIETFRKGNSNDWGNYFVAMAYWQSGDKDRARSCLASADAWVAGYETRWEGRRKRHFESYPKPVMLHRIRTEAAALMGVEPAKGEAKPETAPGAKVP